MAFLHTGIFEGAGAFFCYFVVMAQNGFRPYGLIGIRAQWDNAAINDLEDSYGQEWVCRNKKQTDFLVQIIK